MVSIKKPDRYTRQSDYKEGKRLYETKFNINKPVGIRSLKAKYINLAGQYQEEIEKQIIEINKNAKIIGPKLFN